MPQTHPYPRLARLTLAEHLAGRVPTEALLDVIKAGAEVWSPRQACFVSIKTKDGQLRGCIGTITPLQADLAGEIMANAVSASTRDPRFEPMRAEELDNVVLSVDVLGTPEPVFDFEDLDPLRWGVIVSKGVQRGVLLPDLDGVDTVEKQVNIAARKAGLTSLGGVSLQRFGVDRYPEKD